MKELKIGKHVVLFYSDPEELNVQNYKLYTKYLAIASDIGDDFTAVDKKINDILLVAGDKSKTITEVNNLRQTIYNIYNIDLSIDSKLLAIMVHSIDGVEQKDKSEDGLERITKKLEDMSVADIKKKNSEINAEFFETLQSYFPKRFSSPLDMARGVALQKLLLEWIHVKDFESEELDELRREYQELTKPNNFIGENTFETVYVKEFEEVCHTLQGYSKRDIKKMNVVEYYSLIDYVEEKQRSSKGFSLASLIGLF